MELAAKYLYMLFTFRLAELSPKVRQLIIHYMRTIKELIGLFFSAVAAAAAHFYIQYLCRVLNKVAKLYFTRKGT
jgi:hypothetical protein